MQVLCSSSGLASSAVTAASRTRAHSPLAGVAPKRKQARLACRSTTTTVESHLQMMARERSEEAAKLRMRLPSATARREGGRRSWSRVASGAVGRGRGRGWRL